MIDETSFQLCASRLSALDCPDCGGRHSVSVRFDDRGVASWSVDGSAQSCEGFKDLVNDRLNKCANREPNPNAEFLLRRFLGDPSL